MSQNDKQTDLGNLDDWIGKTQIRTEIIDVKHAGLLAMTFGSEPQADGTPLPHCWHWAWFNDALPPDELGRDGHPKRGGFLPPVPLPRRMWAGGDIHFHAPIVIGRTISKHSTILDIAQKHGRSGSLCIVKIRHQLYDSDTLCIDEEQHLVFREDPVPGSPAPEPIQPPQDPETSFSFTPDPILMFRYSALTFNGHRIHYDADYARNVEGYPGLVFHAPLTATNLISLAKRISGDRPILRFSYRATAPLFAGDTIVFHVKEADNQIITWANAPNGGQAMLAEVTI